MRVEPGTAPAPQATGFDAWAADYARLGDENPVYAAAKRRLWRRVDEVAARPAGGEAWALDFHCGAGDDLPRLLARGFRVVGCDGSAGMLQAAAGRCAAELGSGRLELWHGRAEDMDAAPFGGRRFALVFSATGGFAYLDDAAFVRAHRILAGALLPDGVLVAAHLGPFCLAETIQHLLHLRPRRALLRWRGRVPVTVRGEPLRMHLRTPGEVRRLLAGVMRIESLTPLSLWTPPFQSGFTPGPRRLAVLHALEQVTRGVGALAALADQVVCVARPLAASASTSR